jgi:hypothetical protein
VRSSSLVAFSIVLAACGGAQDRPEPPSGAVDPGTHGLATPGEARGASGSIAAAPAGAGALGAPLAGAQGGAPSAKRAPDEATGEAGGKLVMTREHCETLGRKFAELTMEQGGMMGAFGDRSALEREAEGIGKTFADRCAKDMAGKDVEAREYQCMLRARTPNDLLGCKR